MVVLLGTHVYRPPAVQERRGDSRGEHVGLSSAG